jgi:hypothetical protein
VASVLAQTGQHEQAASVAAQAEALARSITDPDSRALALAAMAQVLARAGNHERATEIADSIPDLDTRAEALAAAAGN